MLYAILWLLIGFVLAIAMMAGVRWWRRRDEKLARAEDLIIKLHTQAQDASLTRIALPRLETGFAIPLIFHRERFDCRDDHWYGPWKIVPDYGQRRDSHYSNLPKRNGFYVRITDEYKSHTIRVAWGRVESEDEFRVELPDQSPSVTSGPQCKAESDHYSSALREVLGQRKDMACLTSLYS